MRQKLSRGLVLAVAATGIVPLYGIPALADSLAEVPVNTSRASTQGSHGAPHGSASGDDRELGDDGGYGGDSDTPEGYGDTPSTQPSTAPPATKPSSPATDQGGYGDENV
ncbi:hypothetical protein ACFYO0_09490, partial [Streptomyces sp. NPDC006365]